MAFRVVVFPAPLLPKRDTIWPFSTLKETPFNTCITSEYTTDILFNCKRISSITTPSPRYRGIRNNFLTPRRFALRDKKIYEIFLLKKAE
jgi:hypothetical protein